MIYESLLLFGVLFVAGWIFDFSTKSQPAASLWHLRQIWLFIVLGNYFIFFWCRSGQTLAMKTWRIKLIAPGYAQVPLRNAITRYILAWMWFLPATAIDYAFGLKQWVSVGVIALGMALWGATMLMNKNRQFLHDKLASTQLIRI
jgi:uncharacterized RDD family membrane protein YckC